MYWFDSLAIERETHIFTYQQTQHIGFLKTKAELSFYHVLTNEGQMFNQIWRDLKQKHGLKPVSLFQGRDKIFI